MGTWCALDVSGEEDVGLAFVGGKEEKKGEGKRKKKRKTKEQEEE